ncbi:thioredoxin family protein [Maritimibacter sp. UBA3975]|uniref:thioredoxin family protein n=1 Tax=Maritimibacter sp. UBA3975 TaxID=1946833 RepID=UPI000C0A6585|nr:thioredoxin family protein [Maritimibacter sp. UBA3975]MAM60303.1 thioredoxin [Maritimibacter sp.]|tara:strand:- start:38828 stop:39415 length:588 start_codon:yes stop_codon:yes gene_type:complete
MRFLTTLATTIAFALPAVAATMGDDGLHKADWMHDTFRDMSEDLADAEAEGKRLLVIWEQRGCVYCRKMHEEVFVVPAIHDKLMSDYYVVQMNMFGDVEVTDFDGEALPEKEMALKWGVMFTPTMMFFPPESEVAEGATGRQAAVVMMPGAFGKSTTDHLLDWVLEEGYNGDENFQKYHYERFNAEQAAGTAMSD